MKYFLKRVTRTQLLDRDYMARLMVELEEMHAVRVQTMEFAYMGDDFAQDCVTVRFECVYNDFTFENHFPNINYN